MTDDPDWQNKFGSLSREEAEELERMFEAIRNRNRIPE